VPIRFLHPAFVGVGVLRAFVNNRAAPQNPDAADVEEVEATKDERAGREVVGFAGLGIDALAVNAGWDDVDVGTGWWRWWRRADEEKEHRCVIQEVSWS
jgi:hypothetical protein